jgi:DNA-binding NarL/FixJ family response regulator
MLRMALGNSLHEIGRELHLSAKTVGTYRTRILEKMGFRRNVDITLYAVRNGMI